MRGLADLVLVFRFWTAIGLARHLRRRHPKELQTIRDTSPSYIWVGSSLFPRWWNEAVMLQDMSLFWLNQIPVHILADDTVFKRIKRLRSGFSVWCYAAALGIVISELS